MLLPHMYAWSPAFAQRLDVFIKHKCVQCLVFSLLDSQHMNEPKKRIIAKIASQVVAHFSLNLSQGLSSAQVVQVSGNCQQSMTAYLSAGDFSRDGACRLQGREQYGANELPAEEGDAAL